MGKNLKKDRNMIRIYSPSQVPDTSKKDQIGDFLYKHLENYGDPRDAIGKAMDYALGRQGRPGGLIITWEEQDRILGSVVLNKTGMEGYIPENILVYIATDAEHRGKGIGSKLIAAAVEHCPGDIALHVEPDNPARRLYERWGFTNKYLEMRRARS